MTKPSRGPDRLARFVPGLIEATLAARGLGEASLVADWPEIVGADIARFARPIELQWPPRGPNRDPGSPAAPATLILRIDGAFALEAQHCAPTIVERVNAHLGWRCVEKLAFRQGPLPPERPRHRPPPPPPSAAAESEARALAAPIEDEALRAALTRLGARAIDGSQRRFGAAGAPPRTRGKGDKTP